MFSEEHDRRVPFQSETWGPASVAEQDLELLADMTGLSVEQCLARLNSYSPRDLAEAWREENPSTPEEILAFYRETDLYLWELVSWNGSAIYRSYLARVDRLAQIWPPAAWPAALDYGCGIGTAAIALAEHGFRITVADVPGSTLEFARRRLAARSIEFDELVVEEDVPSLEPERWDVLVCFDVLEHLVDPASAARELVRAIREQGGLAIVGNFAAGEDHPQHLTSGVELFGGIRWDVFLGGLGLQNLGSQVYRKAPPAGRFLRRLNYEFARVTGFRLQRVR